MQKKIEKFLKFIFPDEKIAVITVLIAIFLIIVVALSTFLIVSNRQKAKQHAKEQMKTKTETHLELLTPHFDLTADLNFESSPGYDIKPFIQESNFSEFMRFRQFADYTKYIYTLTVYEKKIDDFFK